jgi:hypothetical protein
MSRNLWIEYDVDVVWDPPLNNFDLVTVAFDEYELSGMRDIWHVAVAEIGSVGAVEIN